MRLDTHLFVTLVSAGSPTRYIESEVAVIRIDNELLYVARRLINGANVHRINTLIFQYQQSVAITNAGGRSTIDPTKFEQRLRDWVISEESKRGSYRKEMSRGGIEPPTY